MEMFIQIEKNPDGSHATQHGGSLQNGWAYWDTDQVPMPATFPWVEIETAEVSHEAVMDGEKVLIPAYTQLEVVSATEGEVIEVETVVSPTQLDRIEAQVTYTAMMTDTMMEG